MGFIIDVKLSAPHVQGAWSGLIAERPLKNIYLDPDKNRNTAIFPYKNPRIYVKYLGLGRCNSKIYKECSCYIRVCYADPFNTTPFIIVAGFFSVHKKQKPHFSFRETGL